MACAFALTTTFERCPYVMNLALMPSRRKRIGRKSLGHMQRVVPAISGLVHDEKAWPPSPWTKQKLGNSCQLIGLAKLSCITGGTYSRVDPGSSANVVSPWKSRSRCIRLGRARKLVLLRRLLISSPSVLEEIGKETIA